MEKADAERLVHAVWHSKRDFEAAHGVRITLPDYLAVYLQVRHSRRRTASVRGTWQDTAHRWLASLCMKHYTVAALRVSRARSALCVQGSSWASSLTPRHFPLPIHHAVQRKYGAAKAAAEAAYNLVYTLGQHQYDPDCYLVVKVRQAEGPCGALCCGNPCREQGAVGACLTGHLQR